MAEQTASSNGRLSAVGPKAVQSWNLNIRGRPIGSIVEASGQFTLHLIPGRAKKLEEFAKVSNFGSLKELLDAASDILFERNTS